MARGKENEGRGVWPSFPPDCPWQKEAEGKRKFPITIFRFRSSVCEGEETPGSDVAEEAFKICKRPSWGEGGVREPQETPRTRYVARPPPGCCSRAREYRGAEAASAHPGLCRRSAEQPVPARAARGVRLQVAAQKETPGPAAPREGPGAGGPLSASTRRRSPRAHSPAAWPGGARGSERTGSPAPRLLSAPPSRALKGREEGGGPRAA